MHGRNLSGKIRTSVVLALFAGSLVGCDKAGENADDPANAGDPNSLATDTNRPNLPHQRTAVTHQIAGFEVIAGPSKLDIRRDGNTYWSHAATGIALQTTTLKNAGQIPLGSDITGDGLANLVIHETGAGDGLHRYTILSLDQEVDVIAQLDAPDNAGFRDFDGDGVLEFVTQDQAWTDALANDAPRLVLRWNGTSYAASARDLARQAPRIDQLEPKIEQIVLADSWQAGTPPKELTAEALALAYAGHEDLALRFIRWSWPEGQPGRDAFLSEFQTTLRSSPHYTQMAAQFASADGG